MRAEGNPFPSRHQSCPPDMSKRHQLAISGLVSPVRHEQSSRGRQNPMRVEEIVKIQEDGGQIIAFDCGFTYTCRAQAQVRKQLEKALYVADSES